MSPLKRKLRAIVFTDIVGYTTLSAKDEEGAYKLVKKQRKILKPIVEQFEGEWLKEGLSTSWNKNIRIRPNCKTRLQEKH